MPSSEAIVAEVANELATWPGVSFERREDGAMLVRYEQHELGSLYPARGVAEIPVLDAEHDELIEHGDAEPGETTSDSTGVGHDLHGPSDVTAVLELFDRRYRDLRGDDDPYSSSDPS
jgi:Luciferase